MTPLIAFCSKIVEVAADLPSVGRATWSDFDRLMIGICLKLPMALATTVVYFDVEIRSYLETPVPLFPRPHLSFETF